ncbi:YopX family protein [Bacillus haynesii]|uniref:YopX family protein n=1 Tax=Bacillus haynesii TaxID=1925021 RepID=UPI00227F6CB0|nr:YopX family protein [Bacillus haynesii]MCY8609902.1 YopX family protein [Bacillus haynesii]
MREIKFRYVLRDRVTEEIFDRFLILNDLETGLEVAYDFDSPRFIDCELVGRCEYTGLKDKNGREIWEGDVQKDSLGRIFKVVFYDDLAAFYGEYPGGLIQSLADCGPDSEYLGTVYENPDLWEAAE